MSGRLSVKSAGDRVQAASDSVQAVNDGAVSPEASGLSGERVAAEISSALTFCG
jgi:hypothetical protein